MRETMRKVLNKNEKTELDYFGVKCHGFGYGHPECEYSMCVGGLSAGGSGSGSAVQKTVTLYD